MKYSVEYMTNSKIRGHVDSFLTAYHPLNTIPIPIEEIIEFQLRLDIIPLPGLKDSSQQVGLDIDAFISPQSNELYVDQHIFKNVNNRYRFSLAHEIGHLVLHEDFYKQCKFNSFDGWIDVINEMPNTERGKVEWQANQFAGLLLVPSKPLHDEYTLAYEEAVKRLAISSDSEPAYVNYGVTFLLAQRFCVSDAAMSYRLQAEGLLKKENDAVGKGDVSFKI